MGHMLVLVAKDPLLQYVTFLRVRVLRWDDVQWKINPSNPTSVNSETYGYGRNDCYLLFHGILDECFGSF